MRGRIRALLEPLFEDDALVAAAPSVPIREIFRRFWPYARPYRRWLLVSLVLIAVVPAIETATIWMFKIVVDRVLVPHDFGALWWIALAYLGLTLAGGVASFPTTTSPPGSASASCSRSARLLPPPAEPCRSTSSTAGGSAT